MAHCVISAIADADVDDALVPACIVHTTHAPCTHDGEPANPARAPRLQLLRARGRDPHVAGPHPPPASR